MSFNNARRYYLRKSQELYLLQEEGLAAAWRGKQDGMPGTALPLAFPFLSKLAAARYTTKEDLEGASVDELQTFAGFTRRDAQTVLTAWAKLP